MIIQTFNDSITQSLNNASITIRDQIFINNLAKSYFDFTIKHSNCSSEMKKLNDNIKKLISVEKLKTIELVNDLVLPHAIKNYDWGDSTQRRLSNNKFNPVFKCIKKQYLHNAVKILEIGCGTLIGQEASYLSTKLNLHSNCIFSDHPTSKAIQQSKKVTPFDITCGQPFNRKFDRIIGNNVIDTLPYKKIALAMRSISETLSQDGLFIHLTDQEFYCPTFYDACRDEDVILLPGSNKEIIYQISRDLYEATLEDKKSEIPRDEYLQLKQWAEATTQFQVASINDANFDKKLNFSLLNWRVQQIFGIEKIETIHKTTLFTKTITAAIQQNGMNVILNNIYFAKDTIEKLTLIVAKKNFNTP